MNKFQRAYLVLRIDNKRIKVPFRVLLCDNHVQIQLWLFNFSLTDSRIVTGKIKGVEFKKKLECILSINNSFLQDFSFVNIPTVLPISAVKLNIYGSQFQMSLPNGLPLPAGDYTINSQGFSDGCDKSCSTFVHKFQQVIRDCDYFQIPETQFDVPVTVSVENNHVRVHIPEFSFTTIADLSPNNPLNFIALNTGGSVDTFANSLRETPDQIQTRVVEFNNNSFNISIDTYGKLTVQAANYLAGIIPPGTYTVPATTIEYFIFRKRINFCPNVLDPSFNDMHTWQGIPASVTLRDSHVNDSFKGVQVFAWISNSTIPKTFQASGVDNVFFAKIKKGQNQHYKPKQLTFYDGANGDPSVVNLIFDTAVTINRAHPKNIVVSFGHVYIDGTGIRTREFLVLVSENEGETFSGPFPIAPASTNPVDVRGVLSDKFGNIWACISFVPTTEAVSEIQFYISTDHGKTYTLVYQSSDGSSGFGYDYPQFFIGGKDYGLVFVADFFNTTFDLIPRYGRIPIYGPGSYGAATVQILNSLSNEIALDQITTSDHNNTAYLMGSAAFNLGMYFWPETFTVIDKLKQVQVKTIVNSSTPAWLPSTSLPTPIRSYLRDSIQSIWRDDSTKPSALYAIINDRPNDFSQDHYLSLYISLNEGTSWSNGILLGSSIANRGFATMWKDEVTGSLSIAWYDGINDPSQQQTQYLYLTLDQKELQGLVDYARKRFF